MQLKILLPFEVFLENENGTFIVARTSQGSFGVLPYRLDCVAALSPGILSFKTEGGDAESYVAIDEGVLVKEGKKVFVSVRNAIGGLDLGKLKEAVEHEFLSLDEKEKSVRAALAKLESGFLRRLARFHHG